MCNRRGKTPDEQNSLLQGIRAFFFFFFNKLAHRRINFLAMSSLIPGHLRDETQKHSEKSQPSASRHRPDCCRDQGGICPPGERVSFPRKHRTASVPEARYLTRWANGLVRSSEAYGPAEIQNCIRGLSTGKRREKLSLCEADRFSTMCSLQLRERAVLWLSSARSMHSLLTLCRGGRTA